MPVVLFRFDCAASVEGWDAIDDRVMGGVSRSQLRYHPDGYALFEGLVSLERNGGFSSVRSASCDKRMTGVSSYLLELEGDGKRYKLNLRMDDEFDGVSYQAAFEPAAGLWMTVELKVTDFNPTFRGHRVDFAPSLDPGRVRQFGLMISDRQEGPFALALRSIGAK